MTTIARTIGLNFQFSYLNESLSELPWMSVKNDLLINLTLYMRVYG